MPAVSDPSAVVTALLLAIALPPLLPCWLTVLGTVFAIVVAKHLYGGLGYNPSIRPMIGYVLLLVSYPVEMTAQVAADHAQSAPARSHANADSRYSAAPACRPAVGCADHGDTAGRNAWLAQSEPHDQRNRQSTLWGTSA